MTGAQVDLRSGRARRRDATRAEVLAIVERRLREGATFADVTVGEIVGEAGISRTTFYVYFEDKADLLRSWYTEVTSSIVEAARRWWRIDGSATREQVREALGGIVEAYRAHPELMAATHEAVGYDRGVRECVETSMRAYIEGLTAHITAGQEAGFIDSSLPPAETAYWMQWMAERGLQRMARAAPGDAERLLEAYAGIVWNSLYAPARG